MYMYSSLYIVNVYTNSLIHADTKSNVSWENELQWQNIYNIYRRFIYRDFFLYIYLFTVIYIVHFSLVNAQMCCTGYEMVRCKDTQASHLDKTPMHTLCAIREQPFLAGASTILDRCLSHTHEQQFLVILVSDQ